MCQHRHGQDDAAPQPPQPEAQPLRGEPFPWHLGVYDAHCHPTDTMASLASLATARTRALAIMATRAQDQRLVAQAAAEHGIAAADGGRCRVVPAFGWHPWFSHQLYDDSAPDPTYSSPAGGEDAAREAKASHYAAVLSPRPRDASFIASLPPPIPLSSLIASTREYLASFPHALVGEVGLDKGFRLPRQRLPGDASPPDAGLTPGGRDGRLLSPYRVQMRHQQAVLRAQLRLAGEAGRAVSVHGVQAHGVLYDTVASCWKGHERRVLSRRERRRIAPGAEESSGEDEDEDEDPEDGDREDKGAAGSAAAPRPFPPRICLHSYSGSADMLKQWLHPSVPSVVFVSFSAAVNLGTDGGRARLDGVVRAVPDDRILVESDLHAAGPEAEATLEHMYRLVCEIKGWPLEHGVRTVGDNFARFIRG
ncbi:hypothetical protein Trco_004141 [Trichoderma cornu-damae]|uniref:Metallo-dependent hydrolase n=1 Tax=Trichoderma cornu-damae TaxID=654480 RepID=A0A9P8QSA1_9HYPO|nr:hypothetical protein Trco_004141 [Trichoderma cornu-damae]